MLTSWFTHARSRKAISSSRPKRSIPVTGKLATEIFFGPSRTAGLRAAGRKVGGGICCSFWRVILPPRVDRVCYRRDYLRKIGRVLEAPRRVFLKKHLKQKNNPLREAFQLFMR